MGRVSKFTLRQNQPSTPVRARFRGAARAISDFLCLDYRTLGVWRRAGGCGAGYGLFINGRMLSLVAEYGMSSFTAILPHVMS